MAENSVRDFAKKTNDFNKDTLEKSKIAATETSKIIEQAYTTASEGAVDFNLHFMEIAQANMNATFDLARQLTQVKSPTEFFELTATHARKQFETFTQQGKQLTTLAQNAAKETARPFQAGISKTFNQPFNSGAQQHSQSASQPTEQVHSKSQQQK